MMGRSLERSHVTDQLLRLFAVRLNLEVPSPTTDIISAGILDSLALVDLLVLLETEMEVTIEVPDLELEDFRTIDRIASLVERLRTSDAVARKG